MQRSVLPRSAALLKRRAGDQGDKVLILASDRASGLHIFRDPWSLNISARGQTEGQLAPVSSLSASRQ